MKTTAKLFLFMVLAMTACSNAAAATQELCGRPYPKNWQRAGERCHLCVGSRLTIKGDQMFWNGKRVSYATLQSYFRSYETMVPTPITVVDARVGASCAVVLRARRLMENLPDCRPKKPYSYCRYGSEPLGW